MRLRTLAFVMTLSATAGFVVARLIVTPSDSLTHTGSTQDEQFRSPGAHRVDGKSTSSSVPVIESRTQPSPASRATPILDALLTDLTENQVETVLVSACMTDDSVQPAIVNE